MNLLSRLALPCLFTLPLAACGGSRVSLNDLYITENGASATRVCPALEVGFLDKAGRRLNLSNRADLERSLNVNLAERQPISIAVYDAEGGTSSVTGIWGVYVSCAPTSRQPAWDAQKSSLQNQIAVYEWQKANPSLHGQTILGSPLSYDARGKITVDIVPDELFDPTMIMGDDSDHDGVPDSIDQCPNVPRGETPNPNKVGCPLPQAMPPTAGEKCRSIGAPAVGFERFVCWLNTGATVPANADLTQAEGVWFDTMPGRLPAIARLDTTSALSTDVSLYNGQGDVVGSVPNLFSGTWYAFPTNSVAFRSNFSGVGFRLLERGMSGMVTDVACPTSTVPNVSGSDTCQPG